MYNQTAFELTLDTHSFVSYDLYRIVGTLFKYPNLNDAESFEEHRVVEEKLYASAFAFICSNYFSLFFEGLMKLEDFDHFVGGMEFENIATEVYGLSKSLNIEIANKSFNELISELIKLYKGKILTDIRTLLPEIKMQIGLFRSLFSMDADQVIDLEVNDFAFKKFIQNNNSLY